jgi:hypothetical protein
MARDNFKELVKLLAQNRVAVDRAYLHGLLTGCATIPAMDSNAILSAIAGERALGESVVDTVFSSINLLAEDLSANKFEARFDHGSGTDANNWLDGYFRAVEIHETDWEGLNEHHPMAAASLVALHSMRDAKFHRDLSMELPGPKDLEDDPKLLTDLVQNVYDRFQGPVGDEVVEDELTTRFDFSDAELAAMHEDELMAVITSSDDAVPFSIVRECADRGDAILLYLEQHLENRAHWDGDVDSGDWWGLLHATFILGLMPGEESARVLLGAFRRITFHEYGDLSDWLSSAWPALFRNKPHFATAQIRLIAESATVGWYARCQAVDCVLAAAAAASTNELEGAIDWLAAMCADADEDSEFRVIAGHSLLDFPRERHRPVMEALVDLQEPDSLVGKAYAREDIQFSFGAGDCPEWERFDDPWRFYDPAEIARRQERWYREQRERDSEARSQTFVREVAKVGRNDPCPCGSGKKFKKCCLIGPH